MFSCLKQIQKASEFTVRRIATGDTLGENKSIDNLGHPQRECQSQHPHRTVIPVGAQRQHGCSASIAREDAKLPEGQKERYGAFRKATLQWQVLWNNHKENHSIEPHADHCDTYHFVDPTTSLSFGHGGILKATTGQGAEKMLYQEDGDVFINAGKFQSEFLHGVPPRASKGARSVSLQVQGETSAMKWQRPLTFSTQMNLGTLRSRKASFFNKTWTTLNLKDPTTLAWQNPRQNPGQGLFFMTWHGQQLKPIDKRQINRA